MRGNAGTKILLFIFIVVFVCYGIKTTKHVSAPVIEKSESLSHQHGPNSNSELEGLYFPAATGGYINVQKNFHPSLQLITEPGLNSKQVSLENWQIKESSLLIKDYLFHIYPTHNFW